MEPSANLILSEPELAKVQDANWIFTKHLIMEKAAAILRGQVQEINNQFNFLLQWDAFKELTATMPKISKGENYLQLPYLILDYPAIFEKNNIFALRTFFWWGNFFSINLHVSGIYKTAFQDTLLKNINGCGDLFYCSNENEWQHHFEDNNFKKITGQLKLTEITKNNFIKLAFKYDLKNWNNMPQLLHTGYTAMAGLLKNAC